MKNTALSCLYLMVLPVLACGFMFFGLNSAQAQCLAGIPCAIPLTDNPTPLDPNPQTFPPPDGPNAESSPNRLKTDTNTCDADFMNQVYARAFLEASRETVINQTVIRKPDSVMEYSCFDQFLKDTADFAGPIFSERDWTPKSVPNPGGSTIQLNVFLGADKLDNSLNSLVMQSLNGYVNTNFANDFLGGSANGQNNTIASTVQGAGNGCDFMNSVFFLAKCNNFALDDQMMRFSEFVSTDPRNVFGGTTCTSPITPDMIALAGNDNFENVAFNAVDTFSNLTEVPATGNQCAPPIQTGVLVLQDRFEFDSAGNALPVVGGTRRLIDAVCPNPGCFIDGNSNGTRCIKAP